MSGSINNSASYSRTYIEKFMKYNCAPDLLALDIFPNAKEITESMAAYTAAIYVLGLNPHSEKIAVVSVGDGQKPRTATLMAFLTKWTAFSVDPDMQVDSLPVNRLTIYKQRVEDVRLDLSEFSQVVILMVHSHANMDASLESIRAERRHVIAIPCCVNLDIPRKKYIGYRDEGIWSPKNEVRVWNDV